MKLDFIDNGNEFDFGRTSDDYAKYRDLLKKYDDPLKLKHQIHIEIYRSTKVI